MEEVVKVNGDTSPRNDAAPSASVTRGVTTASTSSSSSSSSSSPAAAKSVISINRNSVTIVSTGRDGRGRTPARVTTTPLRSNQDPGMTAGKGHVSEKIRDTQFVTALSQKIQASGPLTVPTLSAGYCARSAPASLSTSSGVSASHSRSSSSGSSSLVNEDITSKLSLVLQLQQQQQQQQKRQQQQRQSQRIEERPQNAADANDSPTNPASSAPVMVNGGSPPNSSANGGGGSSSNNNINSSSSSRSNRSGASSPNIPPPSPHSALMRSVSEQPALRKIPDASYSPRPQSYSNQRSLTPGNGNENPPHNKNDLMAALAAVVTSGSPAAGLRKTRGPGKGTGVTEVYASKKTSSGTSSTSTTSAATNSSRKENN